MSSNRKLKNILITGGAGFIGSNFIQLMLREKEFSSRLINLDNLTYAGNLDNLKGVIDHDNHVFVNEDICDKNKVIEIFKEYDIDTVIHMAAESHVDRSIESPLEFLNTNILGTFNLLSAAKEYWQDRQDVLFHHVSTDEVYGALGDDGLFTEETSYDPRSPYSASKASSDHIVRAFFHTYNLPIMISNCSNNYGPRQHKEKLIPLMISNLKERKPLPVYGEGKNIRDWIYVDDHNQALWFIINNGKNGETYNIGGNSEKRNIDLVKTLCQSVSKKLNIDENELLELITYVEDRLGHDYRYAIDNSKLIELGYHNDFTFEQGINKTIDWYLNQ